MLYVIYHVCNFTLIKDSLCRAQSRCSYLRLHRNQIQGWWWWILSTPEGEIPRNIQYTFKTWQTVENVYMISRYIFIFYFLLDNSKPLWHPSKKCLFASLSPGFVRSNITKHITCFVRQNLGSWSCRSGGFELLTIRVKYVKNESTFYESVL